MHDRYATIDEPSTGSSATICGGWTGNSLVLRRERHVYTSTSNVVRLQLIQSPSIARFMMKFEGESKNNFLTFQNSFGFFKNFPETWEMNATEKVHSFPKELISFFK
jgi:hypothetical protein